MANFETELRSALAERASTVPVTIAEQLRAKEYHPRGSRRRAVVVTAGLACAAAVAGGAYAGTQPHGTSRTPASETVHLDGYAVTLTGTTLVHGGKCAGRAPTPGRPETVKQAGGVFRAYDGGCLHITLGAPRPPVAAMPARVGTYHGYLRMQAATGKVTLYVEVSTRNWLLFTVSRPGSSKRQLTVAARQLVALAARGIPHCSPELEHAPPCAVG